MTGLKKKKKKKWYLIIVQKGKKKIFQANLFFLKRFDVVEDNGSERHLWIEMV